MYKASQIGYSGELIAASELTKNGYTVLFPTNGSTVYDLVIESESGEFYKVQVKSCEPIDDNILRVDLRRRNSKNKVYIDKDFDILAIVDVENNKVCYLNWEDVKGRSQLSIRYKENGVANGYHTNYKQLLFEEYSNVGDLIYT